MAVPGGRGPAARGNHGRRTRAPAADRADARHPGPGRARQRGRVGRRGQVGWREGPRLRRRRHGRAARARRRGCHRDLSRGGRVPGPGGREADGHLGRGDHRLRWGPAELRDAAAADARRPARPGLVAAVPVTYVAFDLLWRARSLLRSPYAQAPGPARRARPGRRARQRAAFLSPAGPRAGRREPRARAGGRRPQAAVLPLPARAAQRRLAEDPQSDRRRRPDRRLAPPRRRPLPPRGVRSWPLPGRQDWITSARSAPGSPRPSSATSPPGCWPSNDPTRRSPTRCRPTSPGGPEWTTPVLAAEVTYVEITPAGRMRHPVWRGLRPA